MEADPDAVLTESEVRALMRATSERAPTGIRNRALVALLFGSGVKLTEALALAPGDVDLAGGTLQVGREGEARHRTVRLFDPAPTELETWMRQRARLDCAASPYLFCTLEGGALGDAYVRALFARLSKRAGIGKRVTTLGLRDAFCARRMAEQIEPAELRLQLGHGELRTTLGYLYRVAGGGDGGELLSGASSEARVDEVGPALPAPPPIVEVRAIEPVDPGSFDEFRPLTALRPVELDES